jgi:hypothetical protein
VITAVPLVAANVCAPESDEPLMLVVCALADEHAIHVVSMTAAAGRTHLLRRHDPLIISKHITGCILCTLTESRPECPNRLLLTITRKPSLNGIAVAVEERDRRSESHEKNSQHPRETGQDKPVPLFTHEEYVAGSSSERLWPERRRVKKIRQQGQESAGYTLTATSN